MRLMRLDNDIYTLLCGVGFGVFHSKTYKTYKLFMSQLSEIN